MKFSLPILSMLSLMFLSTGCSDADQIASAYEDVCKANCECPNELEDWNSVGHCKAACEGDSKAIRHAFLDRENEPCKDIADIAGRIADCAAQDCVDMQACVGSESIDLNTCWPDDTFRSGESSEYVGHLEAREALREQITAPFPESLLEVAFESAQYED